ncbi:MAG: flippase [Candidatus Harrisonbacteria bacterium]|nr:flippase [Candidatus Harrisonbacteria bacterium]
MNKILQNTAWLSVSEGVGRALRAILVIASARILGADDWGALAYTLGVSALITLMADFGMGAVITRELSKSDGDKKVFREKLAAAFWLRTISLLLFFFLLFTWLSFFSKVTLTPAIIFLTGLLFAGDSLRGFFIAINRATERMEREALINIVTQVSITALGIIALFTFPNILFQAGVYALGSILGAVLAFFTVRGFFSSFFSDFQWQVMKGIVQSAWPFALLSILTGLNLNIDILMLSYMRSVADIGYYSVAQKIVLFLGVLPTLVASAAFPSLSRLAGKDKEEFGRVVTRAIKMVVLVGLPIAIGGIVVGYELIEILFGPSYQAATTAFRILLLSLFISYPITIINNALFAYDRQRDFINYAVIGVTSNLAFNFLLIPTFGIAGAAASTVITQFISNTFAYFRLKNINPFFLRKELTAIIYSALIMGGVTYLMNIFGANVYATIGSGIIIYTLLIFLLAKEDFSQFHRFLFKK